MGRGGVVYRRARIAGHGKGVTRVAVAGGRLRAGEGADEEREDNEALMQGEEHGGGSVEQLCGGALQTGGRNASLVDGELMGDSGGGRQQ